MFNNRVPCPLPTASDAIMMMVFTPKTGPAGMLVLWDDHRLEGGSFHEEFPVHSFPGLETYFMNWQRLPTFSGSADPGR